MKLLALFFVLSLVHLYPILADFFTKLPYANNGDVSLTLAILYANIRHLGLLRFGQLFHLPFLFPLSNTLTIGFTMFGQALMLLPIFLLGEPNVYAMYNGLVFFAYVAAGYGAYLFFKELQGNETAAVLAAGLYVLLPFRVYNIPHLNLLLNFPIPFALYFLLRYLKNGRRKELLLLNASLLCQFLFDLSHGFYLSVALAFLVVFFALVQRPLPLRSLLGLSLSLLPTMAAVLLVHFPFLQKGVALSQYSPSFAVDQYFPALSFFTAKSTVLLWLKRLWEPWPFFPGFSVILFFSWAFSRYCQEMRDKVLLAVVAGAYAIPGLAAVVFFGRQYFSRIDLLAEIGLAALFVSLAALLVSLRKRLPLELKLASLLLLAVGFVSFQPFPRVFDLFDALAKVLPFLHRSRGLRTAYILPLAILGVFAFGLKAYLEARRGRKTFLWVIVAILLLEHWRWPVAMAKLPEPDPATAKIYQLTAPFPSHFGILELPFVPTSSNMYPLFSRYHDKHTYHGHYLTYDDPLQLGDEARLHPANGLIGLTNLEILAKLKANGLYLVIISDSFIRHVYDGDIPTIWRRIRNNVKEGLRGGLFREVKEERRALLVVLDDSREGRDITYPFPYFALAGKSAIRFRVRAREAAHGRVYFNGRPVAAVAPLPGDQLLTLPVAALAIGRQVNVVRIVSDKPITASEWRVQ